MKMPIARKLADTKNNRELDVPHPRQVVGEPVCKGDPVEAARLDVIVCVGATQKSLQQEQSRYNEEVPCRGTLRGGEPYRFWGTELHGATGLFFIAAVPAEQVVAPEGKQDEANAAEQCHKAEYTPQESLGRKVIASQGLRRPVVRV